MAGTTSHIIGVIGVRDYKGVVYANSEYVEQQIKEFIKQRGIVHPVSIVTGGGRGVEQLVVDWATAAKIPVRKIPPNITQFGQKKAFSVRNNNIVAECHDLAIFWDGSTDIITEAIITAMQLGKTATVYPLI